MNVSTQRLILSLRNISISFGVCMFAVSGIARPMVASSIASTLLYARAIGDSTSISFSFLIPDQLPEPHAG
jgi:hypothetical protein